MIKRDLRFEKTGFYFPEACEFSLKSHFLVGMLGIKI